MGRRLELLAEKVEEDYRRDGTDRQIMRYVNEGYNTQTIAELMGTSQKTVDNRLVAIKKGVSYRRYNLGQLQRYAKKMGCDSAREYREKLAKKKGFKSQEDAINSWFREKGFKNRCQYKRLRIPKPDRWRRNKQELSRIIREKLEELDMTQSDLARQAGLSKQVISFYVNVVDFPNPENAKILARALQIPYKEIKRIAPWG